MALSRRVRAQRRVRTLSLTQCQMPFHRGDTVAFHYQAQTLIGKVIDCRRHSTTVLTVAPRMQWRLPHAVLHLLIPGGHGHEEDAPHTIH